MISDLSFASRRNNLHARGKKENHVKRNSDESASSSETLIEHAHTHTLIFSKHTRYRSNSLDLEPGGWYIQIDQLNAFRIFKRFRSSYKFIRGQLQSLSCSGNHHSKEPDNQTSPIQKPIPHLLLLLSSLSADYILRNPFHISTFHFNTVRVPIIKIPSYISSEKEALAFFPPQNPYPCQFESIGRAPISIRKKGGSKRLPPPFFSWKKKKYQGYTKKGASLNLAFSYQKELIPLNPPFPLLYLLSILLSPFPKVTGQHFSFSFFRTDRCGKKSEVNKGHLFFSMSIKYASIWKP